MLIATARTRAELPSHDKRGGNRNSIKAKARVNSLADVRLVDPKLSKYLAKKESGEQASWDGRLIANGSDRFNHQRIFIVGSPKKIHVRRTSISLVAPFACLMASPSGITGPLYKSW
jgi:hypothetical protein